MWAGLIRPFYFVFIINTFLQLDNMLLDKITEPTLQTLGMLNLLSNKIGKVQECDTTEAQ